MAGNLMAGIVNATQLTADSWKNQDGTENFKCRAWVNFNGTTAPITIKSSGNVSSITDNGVGDITISTGFTVTIETGAVWKIL